MPKVAEGAISNTRFANTDMVSCFWLGRLLEAGASTVLLQAGLPLRGGGASNAVISGCLLFGALRVDNTGIRLFSDSRESADFPDCKYSESRVPCKKSLLGFAWPSRILCSPAGQCSESRAQSQAQCKLMAEQRVREAAHVVNIEKRFVSLHGHGQEIFFI